MFNVREKCSRVQSSVMNVINVGKRAREQLSHQPRGGRAGRFRQRKLPRGVLNFGQLRGRIGSRAAVGRTCGYRASETPGCPGHLASNAVTRHGPPTVGGPLLRPSLFHLSFQKGSPAPPDHPPPPPPMPVSFRTLQSQSGRVSAPFRRLPVNRRPCSPPPPDITGAAVKHVPTFQSCKKNNLKKGH